MQAVITKQQTQSDGGVIIGYQLTDSGTPVEAQDLKFDINFSVEDVKAAIQDHVDDIRASVQASKTNLVGQIYTFI